MKTYTLKPQDIERRWWLVDAAEQPLGRLASRIAQILRGKHKPTFTPHVNGGDFVIVINAEKVQLTGRKIEQKRYFRHTGYMGHERFTPVQKVLGKHPERVIEKAVWGMLQKTTLTGQAGAMRLGIARALVLADDRHRKKLREQGLLTRDPRAVERKKPGRAGARKRYQFSKR